VRGRTVALDHGTRRYQDVVFYFFGVPGQERFLAVQESLMQGAHAALVVVPQGMALDPVTRHWCSLLAEKAIPMIRVWNRFAGSRIFTDNDPDRHFFVYSVELDLSQGLEAKTLLPLLYQWIRREAMA
ncbi:MAG: hypothetical protein NZ742_08275, partial [Acidobacteria bacterium]|nr:hypothetical protein [Acidobacteriota bacterium]MDW7984765.1 hypothetical protein [Acidobacteriota bacterium]